MSLNGSLFVTDQGQRPTVLEYDARTGAFLRVAASGGHLANPLGIAIGPDENLLVSDGATNQVKRYKRSTGAFMDVFAMTHVGPEGMTIHQGSLYVATQDGVQVFDAHTGTTTGEFVFSLANPRPRDVKVNPANNRLYVLYYNDAAVETFDLATGASHGLLLPAGAGGLSTPDALAFGPDGSLYITSCDLSGTNGVRRYDPTTGAFIDLFAEIDARHCPVGIAFGPDGNLYAATGGACTVMRFDYPTGAFIDFFVPEGTGGLTNPFHMTFSGRGASISGQVFGHEPEAVTIDPLALVLRPDLYVRLHLPDPSPDDVRSRNGDAEPQKSA